MRSSRFLMVLAAVGALAACNKDPGVDLTLPQTEADVSGAFHLAFANGLVPPFQAQVTTTELWTLDTDVIFVVPTNAQSGTWADTTGYDITSLSDGTESSRVTATSGTYTVANGQINFVKTVGGSETFVGAVSQGSLIVNFGNRRYIYTK